MLNDGRFGIVDAHGYAKRLVVRADEILTAFMELASAALFLPGHEHPQRRLLH